MEKIRVTYTDADVKTTFRIMQKRLIAAGIVYAVAAVFAAVIYIIDSKYSQSGSETSLLTICMIALIICVSSYFKNKKLSLKHTSNREYEYAVFEDRMEIEILKSGETEYVHTVRPNAVLSYTENTDYILFQSENGFYIIPKNRTPQYEIIKDFLVNKAGALHKSKKNTATPVVLFYSALISLIISVVIDRSGSGIPVEYKRFIFPVLLIAPIASLIYGVIIKNKQATNAKSSIFIGLISTILVGSVCISGFVNTSGNKVELNNNDIESHPAVISYFKNQTGLYIPFSNEVYSYDRTEDEQYRKEFVSRETFIYYEENDANELLKKIEKDNRWTTDIPTHLEGCYAMDFIPNEYEHYLLFNTDEKSFNALPSNEGKFSFICIGFDKEDSMLHIVEYTKTAVLLPEPESH